jgi:hypothetical protein
MRWLIPMALLVSFAARAEEPRRLQVTIRDHRFQPAELHVPANTAFVVDVQNDDATAEEFESAELGVEKVIAGGRHLPVRIRAMPPGRYPFMGEYHSDTAQGVVIVDPAR